MFRSFTVFVIAALVLIAVAEDDECKDESLSYNFQSFKLGTPAFWIVVSQFWKPTEGNLICKMRLINFFDKLIGTGKGSTKFFMSHL